MVKAKVTAAILLAAALALGTANAALAQAQGSNSTGNAPGAADSAAPVDPGSMNDGEKAAAGCGIAATGAMLATYIAGPTEITLLWGGGMLVPGNSVTLALSLLGQIGASFCAIGLVATPTVLWAYDQSDNITAKAFQFSGEIGRDALAALGFGRSETRMVADRGLAVAQ